MDFLLHVTHMFEGQILQFDNVERTYLVSVESPPSSSASKSSLKMSEQTFELQPDVSDFESEKDISILFGSVSK